MTTTVEAIYENGKLLLSRPLALREKSSVRVTIESDPEREAWLKHSEASLTKIWDNDADDVFNELLTKLRIPMISDTCSNPYRTPFRGCRTVVGAKRRSE